MGRDVGALDVLISRNYYMVPVSISTLDSFVPVNRSNHKIQQVVCEQPEGIFLPWGGVKTEWQASGGQGYDLRGFD
jgi:hypothetical protein